MNRKCLISQLRYRKSKRRKCLILKETLRFESCYEPGGPKLNLSGRTNHFQEVRKVKYSLELSSSHLRRLPGDLGSTRRALEYERRRELKLENDGKDG